MPKPCSGMSAIESGFCAATAVCDAYATYVEPQPVKFMQRMRWVNKLDTESMSGEGVVEDPQGWATKYGTKYGPDIAVFMVVPAVIGLFCMIILTFFCFCRVCRCCRCGKSAKDEEDEVLDSMPTCFMDRVVPITIYFVTASLVLAPVALGLYALPTLVVGFTQAAGEAGCLLDDAIDWTKQIAIPMDNLTVYANETIKTARGAISNTVDIAADHVAVTNSLASLSDTIAVAVASCGGGQAGAALSSSLRELSTNFDARSGPAATALSSTLSVVDTSTTILQTSLSAAANVAGSTLDLVSGLLNTMKSTKDTAMGYLAYVSQFNLVAGIGVYSAALLFLVIVPILSFILCLARREALCLRCCIKTLMEIGMGVACSLTAAVLLLVILLTPWSLVFSDVCVVIDDATCVP